MAKKKNKKRTEKPNVHSPKEQDWKQNDKPMTDNRDEQDDADTDKDKDRTSDADESNARPDKERKIKIEIVKYEKLVEILKDGRSTRRLLLAVLLIIVVLFLGLTTLALSIKHFFPYNTIKTTQYGAVVIKSEEKDVAYWLLNASGVWANSGFVVKKGDELTIRSSGASFTAVHHLVDDAKSNNELKDKWVGADGQEKRGERDSLRALFRLAPNYPESMLLMQIFPVGKENNGNNWLYEQNEEDLKAGVMIAIGKESRNIVVPCDGTLHFMVNDILLTDETIEKMYERYFEKLCEITKKDSTNKTEILKRVEMIRKDSSTANCQAFQKLIQLNKECGFNNMPDSIWKKKGFAFAKYPTGTTDAKNKKNEPSLTSSQAQEGYPLITELLYYKEKGFRDAWYADNLGSFLIVIERKREKP